MSTAYIKDPGKQAHEVKIKLKSATQDRAVLILSTNADNGMLGKVLDPHTQENLGQLEVPYSLRTGGEITVVIEEDE